MGREAGARMTALPARLKEARTASGLTQTDVSERTGITQGNVSEYETGSRSPELATLTRLADVYGVSLDWLVGRDHVGPRASPRRSLRPEDTTPELVREYVLEAIRDVERQGGEPPYVLACNAAVAEVASDGVEGLDVTVIAHVERYEGAMVLWPQQPNDLHPIPTAAGDER